MESEQEVEPLGDLARKFAQSLTGTVHAVAPNCAPFTAKYIEGGDRASVRQSPKEGIPLEVDGVPFLDLEVTFECCMDDQGDYLAIQKSKIAVSSKAGNNPLFRYEYDRRNTLTPPSHMHVHAHRDAFTYLMATSGKGSRRSRDRNKSNRIPALQDIHFPLGGHRFRPCLEDVLEILIEEFGVDKHPGTMDALRAGRIEWRRTQTKSVVRDDPESAIEVLRTLGYEVKWCEDDREPSRREDRLGQY